MRLRAARPPIAGANQLYLAAPQAAIVARTASGEPVQPPSCSPVTENCQLGSTLFGSCSTTVPAM